MDIIRRIHPLPTRARTRGSTFMNEEYEVEEEYVEDVAMGGYSSSGVSEETNRKIRKNL